MRRLRNEPKRPVKPAPDELNAGGALGMEAERISPSKPTRGAKKLKSTKHKHMR